ncbi:MAG: EI24 domain-containing protein [Bacteroidia bacterium]|nr:EI24 domain-containing protein [Bacteroidia bacterium]
MLGFFRAITAYFRAFGFLSKNKLWSYAIVPGLVSIGIGVVVFILLGSLGEGFVDAVFNWLCRVYPESWFLHDAVCNFTNWLINSWFGEFLSWIFAFLFDVFLFKYIVMIVVPFFMGTLSEKVEETLTGNKILAMNSSETLNSTVRGILMALRNILREIVWVAVITLAGLLIPGVGTIVSTVIIFMVQAFYAGFGNADSLLDRRRMGIKDSVKYARRNRIWLTGNGIPFLLLLFIPFLGWFLAPVLATVAVSMSYIKEESKKEA